MSVSLTAGSVSQIHEKSPCPNCGAPASKRWRDLETGEYGCRNCGTVLGTKSTVAAEMKYHRGPENAAVFRGNKGSTTKINGTRSPEPFHLYAVKSVRSSVLLTKSCPRCGVQQPVKMVNDAALHCENESCGVLACDKKCDQCGHGEISEANGIMKCSKGPRVSEGLICAKFGDIRRHVKFERTQLGEYLLRWNPSNNGNGHALSFWADLRLLQRWDPPEDDPNMKLAREIFREKLLGKIGEEDAHRLASQYLKAVKQISRLPRSHLEDLLETLIDGVQLN